MSCWEDDQPAIFATQAEAEAEIAESRIRQLQEVLTHDRELAEVDDSEWVEPAEWDGENLTTEHHEWTAYALKAMR